MKKFVEIFIHEQLQNHVGLLYMHLDLDVGLVYA